MKTKIISVTAIFSILLTIACGPTVETVKTTDKSLDKYQSFAYLPNSNFENSDIGYDDPSVGISVINAVNQQMQKAGYELDREKPDLLVLIRTKVSVDVVKDTEPVYATYPYTYRSPVSPLYDPYYYNYYFGYGNTIGYTTDTDKYKDGTLIVDLVDRKTKKVVWSGAASDEIYQLQESKAIAEYVDDLFEDFPTVAGY
ncbi:DUF4136 domain-containing protein [Aquimarina brevivitae]|uniref:Uncharacterized protein DUF4136 n=1 Tax=Aquimarina brevivitae TaxID=323412 RepID=A0A4Q7P1L1_9FLAO|nr:DUF4136 domain-containing protein [Aquimarina brevivitae]RZS93457.1 uncharacterized protein DUF4136 [Aquimarina brevivitae]